jgi:hypothetical protein
VALAAGTLDLVEERVDEPGVAEASGERVGARSAEGRGDGRARGGAEAREAGKRIGRARELVSVALERLGETAV